MLSIKLDSKHTVSNWHDWHIGDPIPEGIRRVVTFQADGHELEMVLRAMAAAYVGANSRVGLNEWNNHG